MYGKVVLRAAVGLCLVAACVQTASAAVTIRLAWPTSDKDIDPYAITAHEFAAALDRLAPDEFNVKYFPNHQLGTEVELMQQMQVGALDAGVITGAKVAAIVPAFKVNDLPFIYKSEEQAINTLDGEVGDILLEQLAKKSLVGLGFPIGGFRNVVNNVRPIHKPNDLAGLKIRVQPTDIYISTFKQLGASPVPMDWNDTFTALQQHTIDGMEIPLAVIYANKVAEVTRYLSLTNHTFNVMSLMMSGATFNRLSEDQKQLVRKAAKLAIAQQRKEVAENDKGIIRKLKEAGLEINEVDDLAPFQVKAQPLYKKYKDNIGHGLVQKVLDQR